MIKEKIERLMQSRFSRDTMWLIAAQVVLMFSGFGVNLIVGKIQGAEALGIFSQALAFYTILSTFFALGLNNTITKKISEGQKSSEEVQNILTSNLLVTTLFSGAMSAIVSTIAMQKPELFSSPELAEVVHIPMIALPFFNINKNFGAYFTGLRLQKRFAQQRIVRWSVIILFVIGSVFTSQPVETTLYSFLAAELLVVLINLIQLKGRISIYFNTGVIADNLKFGMKTYIAELISVLNASLDVILIGYFLTNSETGIYSFIVYFAKTLYIFPGIMMQNFSPIVSKTWASGKIEELKARMHSIRRVNRWVVSLQLVALLIGYPIVVFFIKQEFNNTFYLFALAIIGAYVFSLISWSGSMLIMTNKLNENIARTLLIVLLSASCTLGFTHAFGLIGSCLAYTINGVISFLATRQFIRSSLKLSVT
jgi:O-antigen/teichoic acid export membrane protein